jgi:hypothetical protein
MKPLKTPSALMLLLCVLCFFTGTACHPLRAGIHIDTGSEPKSKPPAQAKNRKGGPPPHAPAHGYRAKHTYQYYPQSGIYFDVHRKMYFYLEGDRWQVSVSLPDRLRVRLGEHVTLKMETDRPYIKYDEHKRKYPPGQMKHKKKKKWAKKK